MHEISCVFTSHMCSADPVRAEMWWADNTYLCTGTCGWGWWAGVCLPWTRGYCIWQCQAPCTQPLSTLITNADCSHSGEGWFPGPWKAEEKVRPCLAWPTGCPSVAFWKLKVWKLNEGTLVCRLKDISTKGRKKKSKFPESISNSVDAPSPPKWLPTLRLSSHCSGKFCP